MKPIHAPSPAPPQDETSRLRAELADAHREIYRLREYTKTIEKTLNRYREMTSLSREQR